MRTLLIVAGILLVLFVGFQALDRNKVNDEMKTQEQRIQQLEGQMERLDERYQLKDGVNAEENPIDKTESNLDQKEDELDDNIEMPYEEKDTNQNTDLIPSDEPKDNNRAGKVKKPNPAKADEPEANASNSIVAFGYVKDGMYEPATEAFKLNLFELAFLGEDSVTAFQLK
jgi:TolA-binding protein